jgi:hypothetical protein
MKCFIGVLLAIVISLAPVPGFALDKFMNYKNYSSVVDENVPVTPDVNYALEQGYINSYLLVASTNKAITVPTDAKFVIFSSTDDIWVRVGGTAVVPSGDTTDGTASELNPSVRYLGSDTTIGIISESAAKVSLMFYK